MTDKYDSNGDYSSYASDFKRDKNKSAGNAEGENGEPNPVAQKANEYVRELLTEKTSLDQTKHRNALRLIDQEITKTQTFGKVPARDNKYVDIYREKPIKVCVKVLVPVKEHPRFNFVGKLLGPKGNSMKRLQEETMCKMAILGRGSMRDRQKEEELRQSLDPKYAHLNDELHVEISALGPPAEAHARIAFALAEVRKYLIPDSNDNIRQEQMREMEIMTASDPNKEAPPLPPKRPALVRDSNIRNEHLRGMDTFAAGEPSKESPLPMKRLLLAPPRPPPVMRTATRAPVTTRSVMPAKTKIMSILDRARIAMEQSYGACEEPYEPSEPAYAAYPSPVSHSRSAYSHHYEPEYEPEYYREAAYEPAHRWKEYKSSTSSSRPVESSRYRSSPYSRPSK